MDKQEDEKVRLDKWLWAARFFKTRSLATEAINGGKVHLNGERVKPGRAIKLGDQLTVRQGRFEKQITIDGLASKRGPAKVAQTLYTESAESIALREKILEQERLIKMDHTAGRPEKHDRRRLRQLKHKQ